MTDFTVLPFKDAVASLRTLGQTLITALLNDDPQPELAELVHDEAFAVLGELNLMNLLPPDQRPSYWEAWFVQRRLSPLTLAQLELVYAPDDMVKAATFGIYPDEAWAARLARQISYDMGGVLPHHLPTRFWNMAGLHAWSDLKLQRWINEQLLARFRDTMLFNLGEFPAVLISPHTFWGLIAMSDTHRPLRWNLSRVIHSTRRLIRRFTETGLKHKERTAIARRLVAQARPRVMQRGWAKFWDQWLLVKALDEWARPGVGLDDVLENQLMSLPVYRMMMDVRRRGSKGPPLISAPDWKGDMPGWFERLYDRKSGPTDSELLQRQKAALAKLSQRSRE